MYYICNINIIEVESVSKENNFIIRMYINKYYINDV